jgi:hypothetical protein
MLLQTATKRSESQPMTLQSLMVMPRRVSLDGLMGIVRLPAKEMSDADARILRIAITAWD